MRRFEREVDGRARFWEVDLQDATISVTTGEIGRTSRTREQSFKRADAAAAKLAQSIAEMERAGWVEVAVAAPEAQVDRAHAAVVADPTDPAGYLVLGDQLQAAGDARGELIAVQARLALEGEDPVLRETETALLKQYRRAFLGDLARLETPWDATWFCGFLSELALHAEGFGTQTADLLQSLWDDGHLGFLQSLRIDGAPHFDAVMLALRRHGWATLRSVTLGRRTDCSGRLTHPLGTLLPSMPALRRLSVSADLARFGPLAHDHLEDLAVHLSNGDALADLDLTALPRLRRFTLGVSTRWAADRRALCAALDVPLAHLTLDGAASIEWLEGLERRNARLDGLTVRSTRSVGHLVALLIRRAALLDGVPIRLVDVDVSDSEMERIAREPRLRVEAELPDVVAKRDRLYASPRQEVLRRFERERKGVRRFWQIVRDGATVSVRYGVVGKDGAVKDSELRSERKAASEYRRRVRKKLAEGWEEVPVR
jgi:predicted DNA-binding WGR domain protein